MSKCDFKKVACHTSAWVFSCKFAAYLLHIPLGGCITHKKNSMRIMITEVSTTDKTFETQKIFEKLGTIIKFFQKSLNSNI